MVSNSVRGHVVEGRPRLTVVAAGPVTYLYRSGPWERGVRKLNVMQPFRSSTSGLVPPTSFDLLAVGEMIDRAMLPGHFFVHADLRLDFRAAQAETIPWEIFHGRLLDAGQTRLSKTFLSWRAILAEDAHSPVEPLIAVRLDVQTREIHVTRGLLAYVWEGYDAGGGVIESREAIKWTRELVGTIALADFAELESLHDELICTIWQAVVGTSRLPLHSVEAPLPAFVFGQLHYVYREDAGDQVCRDWASLLASSLRTPLAWRESVKLLEFALRRGPSLSASEGHGEALRWRSGSDLPKRMRALFNDVSLSPHTCLIDNALQALEEWTKLGTIRIDEEIDFLSWLLRQLGRHLTAYDLVTFHHRGANYPDALLLDSTLKALLRTIESHPHLFKSDDSPARWRRRALRHACLLRRHYEGHLVPDQPTSPGENARVMPASYPRLNEAQLLQPLKRRRQLFENEPLSSLLNENGRRIFAQSLRDLDHADERKELGIGLFIDRPLGYAKAAIEPDLTPLLAHEAYSPSVARRRLQELTRLGAELGLDAGSFAEAEFIEGLAHRELAECPRPVAALADVRKVADDSVIVRTLPGGLTELLQRFDWRPLLSSHRLHFLAAGETCLFVQVSSASGSKIALYDGLLRRRVELTIDASSGYVRRAGVELPRAGLVVTKVWDDTDVLAAKECAIAIRESSCGA